MSLLNATSFAALAAPTLTASGVDVVVAIIKATFTRLPTGVLALADSQSPVRLGDVANHPDAPESSVRFPSDLCDDKPGADVVIVAEAISRTPVNVVDVAVRVGDRLAPLRVHGERVYYRSLTGIAVGPAAPFERKPIVYERAYGGSTPDHKHVDRRNPVGRGVAANLAALVDQPAPQIEHPARPVGSASDRPDPAGYGAIAMSWSPRRERMGTTDESWQRTRMPIPPLDFDARFHQVAHPALQLPHRIRAGTPVALHHMTEDSLFQFDVPRLALRIEARFDDGRVEVQHPEVDTLLVDAITGRVELTARQAFARGRGRRMLREVRVQTER